MSRPPRGTGGFRGSRGGGRGGRGGRGGSSGGGGRSFDTGPPASVVGNINNLKTNHFVTHTTSITFIYTL